MKSPPTFNFWMDKISKLNKLYYFIRNMLYMICNTSRYAVQFNFVLEMRLEQTTFAKTILQEKFIENASKFDNKSANIVKLFSFYLRWKKVFFVQNHLLGKMLIGEEKIMCCWVPNFMPQQREMGVSELLWNSVSTNPLPLNSRVACTQIR